jgi:2-polyprenyl-3-methyl-5-hydroxy-6-metoxy-1,4-benzoquinol methylase
MPFLTQTRFPGAWLVFQNLFGGTRDKQHLALERYRGQSRILEIGCSVGNLTDAFLPSGAAYTGIDIDGSAIAHAQRRFARQSNVRFLTTSPRALKGEEFGYVLLAGILHHVDDRTALQLLQDCFSLLTPGGSIVISEPEALCPGDNVLFRLYNRLEQGQYLRSAEALTQLVESSGARIVFRADRYVGPGIVTRPKVARFTLIEARPAQGRENPIVEHRHSI